MEDNKYIMKILHLQEHYMDGWSYQENILPQKQAKLGNEVVLIASRRYRQNYGKTRYEGANEYFDKKVRIVREDYRKQGMNLVVSNLDAHLYKEKPDLIFLHNMAMIKIRALMKYVRINKPKLVIDVHTDDTNYGVVKSKKDKLIKLISKIRFRFLIWRNKKYIDKVFYVAPSSKKFCRDFFGFSENEIFPLYLGGDFEMINFNDRNELRKKLVKEQKLNDDAAIVVFAGKIDKNKRIDLLIDAFVGLKGYNAYLLLAGSINAECEEYIKLNLRNNHHLRFLGWKNSKDLMDLFLACDLGVYPGGQSVLWQQSLCCGLPCIYSYWEGVDYLNDGNAVILKNRTVEEMQKILKELISDKNRLEEMRAKAFEYGNRKFNYLNIAKQSLK